MFSNVSRVPPSWLHDRGLPGTSRGLGSTAASSRARLTAVSVANGRGADQTSLRRTDTLKQRLALRRDEIKSSDAALRRVIYGAAAKHKQRRQE